MLAGAAAEIALAKAAAAYHQKRVEFASVKTIGVKKTTAQEAAEMYGIDVPDGISLEMPEWLKERAKEEISKSFEGEWWDGIGETTRDDLMNTIKRSLEDGLSIRKVADEIMSKFGGDQYPRYRANNIARTELSNAMNAGHSAGIERLQEETGLPMGKEWVSVMGPTTRVTHADTDGQQTDTADGNFNLAGYEVPWPAHDSLPPEERCNCFPAGVLVAGRTVAAMRAWYEGPFYEIATAGGRRVTVTANHPILTRNGFKLAQELQVGNDLLATMNKVEAKGASENIDNKPAPIEEIFQAFRKRCIAGADATVVKFRQADAADFYGDGVAIQGQIQIVRADGNLPANVKTGSSQKRREFILVGKRLALSDESGDSASILCSFGIDAAAAGLPGVAKPSGGITGGSIFPSSLLPVVITADFDTPMGKAASKPRAADPESSGNPLQRFTRDVTSDHIIEIRVFNAACHVYDLETEDGIIEANGIITSNCQCTVISSFSMSAVDEGDGQPDITDEQGQEDLADDLGDAAPSEDSGVSISPEVDAVEEEYPPANPDGVDSFERQRDSMGVFTAERQALHAAILAELEAAAEVAEAPEYLLMGGGPASGKSTLIKSGEVSLPAKAVHLDSDAIKAKLPEYNAMLKAKDMRAAAFAHEESSYLAKLASQKAFSEQKNVVLDGTGNSSFESLAKKVNAAKAKGFTVRGEYATCSTEEALKRNLARAAKTGRLPPEDMLKYTHASVSKVLPEAIEKGLFDELRLWDTEHLTKGQPTLVVSAKGTDLTVHNQELWDSFKAKAKELEPKAKAEPEPPAKPEVGKVTYGYAGKEETLKALAKTLGEAATLEDAAALAGSQAGAEVRVTASDIGGISISTEHEKFASRRVIRYDAQEKENVMRNVYFYIKEGETGKGLGTKVLSQQVEQAAAFGINKIKTHAARDDDSQEKLNGYYTWPRLGYTGLIKGQEFSQKIFDYADANGLKEIGDFMKTPEHRAWWKANGESFDGEFDTRPGSQSRKVLEEYVRQKAASGTKAF